MASSLSLLSKSVCSGFGLVPRQKKPEKEEEASWSYTAIYSRPANRQQPNSNFNSNLKLGLNHQPIDA
ncbi:hypothetical protein COLO4_18630 [Corchorus olitorius]|uniref:Uncharacterized protein n=1 Tax=Corchorus olitorius TaxID=93759 RepID=A0A1R3J8G8_9ROSI|nr:hypothetical protein COLO4_18630 [Corchorus olitorius]